MTEFENKLIIKDEPYPNGFFPQIPNFNKKGSAFVLTEGINDDLHVIASTVVRDIRRGKYMRIVEISTLPYTKEIRFTSSSREAAYSFDVYVKAVIQVVDAIIFYHNKNIDVDAYFENLFFLDVKKITRNYSILDYGNLDAELTDTLSRYNTYDESTGFSYRISAVSAEPGIEAKEYVRKSSTRKLDHKLKQEARDMRQVVTYEEAVWTEVSEGSLSEREAILKINEYTSASYDEKLKRVEELRAGGFITDIDAKTMITPIALEGLNITNQPQLAIGRDLQESSDTGSVGGLDGFYSEEETE